MPFVGLDRIPRGPLAALATIALATFAFAVLQLANPDLPVAGPILKGEDLNSFFFPAVSFLHSALLDWELPLWNPYQFIGAPFLAGHAAGAAYPPVIVTALAPPHVALTLQVVLHLFLIGMFTYGFARTAGLTNSGAVVMALIYMFAKTNMHAVHNTAYLAAYTWMPAVLWGVQAVVKSPGPLPAAALAITVAMSLLSGYSQAALYTLQIATVFGLTLLLASTQRFSALGWLAAGAGLGSLAAAVQLLPAFELATLGARSVEGLTIAQADPWPIVQGTEAWTFITGKEGRAIHPPPLLIVAAFLAVAKPELRRLALFLLLLLLTVFDFARGRSGWIFPLYFELPLGDIFRIPSRALFLVDFAAAGLVGIGLSNLTRSSMKRTRRVAAVLAAVAGIHALTAASLPYRFDPLAAPADLRADEELIQFAREASNRQERFFIQRSILGMEYRNFGTANGAFTIPGYDPILPGSYKAFFGIPANTVWHGDLDILDFGTLRSRWDAVDPTLLDMVSVRYYVDALNPGTLPTPWSSEFDARVGSPPINAVAPRIHPRPSALPRSYIVHEIVTAASVDDVVRRVRSSNFDPRRQVILEERDASTISIAPLSAGKTSEFANISAYRRNSVEIQALCVSACIVVLTDLWYPGWQVTVDGRPEEILRTNYLLRGVAIPPGEHRIRFEYAPASFRYGVLITAFALTFIVLLATAPLLFRKLSLHANRA